MRIRADENIPPVGNGPQKTIHQRNKSSPALATLAGAGNGKSGVLRTAFGDVSNTVNSNRFGTAKDDLSYPVKVKAHIPEKITVVQEPQDKKSAALLRPAQRPLSVSGLKGLLSTSSNAKEIDTLPKPPTANDHQVPVPVVANTRKVLTKRSTTIFKDTSLPTVTEVEAEVPKISTTTTAPVHQSLIAPRKEISADDNTKSEIREELSLPLDVTHEQSSDVPVNEALQPKSAESIVTEHVEPEEPQIFHDSVPVQAPVVEAQATAAATLIEPNNFPSNSVASSMTVVAASMPDPVHIRHSQPQPQESEEYWDDVETAEEDGYVTAHSYRSRGDNTTGGATTLLFPQVNKHVLRELAAAKQLVEATRTTEEIEDECFDTSMVAEYGDDIFAYMKDLEVRA